MAFRTYDKVPVQSDLKFEEDCASLQVFATTRFGGDDFRSIHAKI